MAVFLDNLPETCYSGPVTGDDGSGSPELREEMPAGSPVTGTRVWSDPNSGGTTDELSFALMLFKHQGVFILFENNLKKHR